MYSIKVSITHFDTIVVRTVILDALRQPLEARYIEPDLRVFVQLPSRWEKTGVIWIETFDPPAFNSAERMEFTFDPPQTVQSAVIDGIQVQVTIDYTNEDFGLARLVNL